MDKTFGLHFDLYQAFKQHGWRYTQKSRETVKKVVRNQNLNKKVLFIVLIQIPITVGPQNKIHQEIKKSSSLY